ncbi:UV-endonuclease UvdE-domain-containing protein [Lentinula guzmanii]|uniref:UV-endonuclease UvdE-domain-containing protein n=1 Tax=Lentinula guzmanii TaxID=2804957 RepID=A0AA38JM46_9AGAR|nr:UV-endonuclease UvdE-domain-containing protein [Lentinula guzmanii]
MFFSWTRSLSHRRFSSVLFSQSSKFPLSRSSLSLIAFLNSSMNSPLTSPTETLPSQRRSARIHTMTSNTNIQASAVSVTADDEAGVIATTTAKRKRVSKEVAKGAEAVILSDLSSLEDVENPPPKTKKKKAGTKKSKRIIKTVKADVDEELDEETKLKKARKPRKPKPEPVYDIPDVERRETKFRGRLGYACLNTILRNKKPASEAVFCSRTCRIDTIKKNGMDWVKDLGRKNVQDLITMIQWNEDNNIRFLRLSSEMFPFASHSIYGYSLEYCAPLLAEAGALAKKYGHRLTTHPGQFTQLGSPKPGVIQSSIRELEYHCQMLDLMRVGKDGVTIIHGGGVYDDKPGTIERIKTTIRDVLPQHVRDRLVLENDELCYNADDLLPICEELDVPLVFDYHHDALRPSSIPPAEIIRRANAIFARRGIRPKQHLSEPRPGAVTIMERRAHADRCERLPDELEDVASDVDLMIEAKDKEQAVLHLYRIYGLQEVKHESLRPPNVNQTKETKGRKSSKRTKKGNVTLDEDVNDLEGQIEGEDVLNLEVDDGGDEVEGALEEEDEGQK